jgi:5-oxoprolinase (ATP-hydrolysing) subunit A
MQIDLNADLGEGAAFDAELMPLVTSANVCCGLHAGDPNTIWKTLELAKAHNVAVGAHPGFADREHFGRREFTVTPSDVEALCREQLLTLGALASRFGVDVRYIKPHGALYNQICRDAALADGLLRVGTFPVVGLPGSALDVAARARNHPFIPEGFADRRYRPDGSLVPRTEPGAFVHDPAEAVTQVEWLIREKGVRTICVHGDNPEAVAFTRAVRESLLARGFTLQAFA